MKPLGDLLLKKSDWDPVHEEATWMVGTCNWKKEHISKWKALETGSFKKNF